MMLLLFEECMSTVMLWTVIVSILVAKFITKNRQEK